MIEWQYELLEELDDDERNQRLNELANYKKGGKIHRFMERIAFEQAFDVKLGNVSRAFNDMKIRNKPALFLDRMREALLDKIDEIEEETLTKKQETNTIEKKK